MRTHVRVVRTNSLTHSTHTVRLCVLCIVRTHVCTQVRTFFLNEPKKNLFVMKNLVIIQGLIKFHRKKPILACSGVGSGTGQLSRESSGKCEGGVLSDGFGASIRRKNNRYTETRGLVSLNTQSYWGFEGA